MLSFRHQTGHDCELITLSQTRDYLGGFFKNSSLASWKSMCKYYSGDANCLPNNEVIKKTTKVEHLNFEDPANFADYPSIDDATEITRENYPDYLRICAASSQDLVTDCTQIDYDFYTHDLLNVGDWFTETENSKCTEIGYLYGLKCKFNQSTNSCISSDCASLNMYTFEDGATEFCRAIGCAKGLANECEVLSSDSHNFSLYELKNEGMSLADINMKCNEEINKVVDISKYNELTLNFGEAEGPVCVDEINNLLQFNHATTSNTICKMVGALSGVQTIFNEHQSYKCLEREENLECKYIEFSLPTYNFTIKSQDIAPVNPTYENGMSFGNQLCVSLGCEENKGITDGNSYICAPGSAKQGLSFIMLSFYFLFI